MFQLSVQLNSMQHSNKSIQFGTAIERYKINNAYIQEQLTKIQRIIGDAPMYEIDHYVKENMNSQELNDRFYLQYEPTSSLETGSV